VLILEGVWYPVLLHIAGKGVAHIRASAEMGTKGSYSNGTYFRDGVHPTEAGTAVYGQYFKVAITQLGLP
jgi:hypothetical protein